MKNWMVLTLVAASACNTVSADLDPTTDADGDGFTVVDDCDDANGDVFPGAEELCNGVDDNCDGVADNNATDAPIWFTDVDGDGFFGTPAATASCTAPPASSDVADDCADLDASRYPGADEQCNGLDDDCDDEIDEDAGDRVPFYADADADGFGDADSELIACAAPPDYVDNSDDCNDADDTVNPDVAERCGPADEDCDGLVDGDDPDLDTSTGTRFYLDRDGDSFGTALFPVFACELPAGASANSDDCDDLSAAIHPDATEVCNQRDDDCDGLVDDADDDRDASAGGRFYIDADGDGYGARGSAAVQSCAQPDGYALTADDCDDGSDAVRPNAIEACNGIDDDCDNRTDDDDPSLDGSTATRWFSDRDGDGHGGTLFSVLSCEAPDGMVDSSDDCNDDDPSTSPSATEVCDTVDNDCDTLVDDADDNLDTSTGSPWHPDGDGDGWGASDETVYACLAPEGYGQDTSDCDDDNPAIAPGADEVCDGIDNDCDGRIDDNDDSLTSEGASYWRDADGDGWGTPDLWACQDFGFGWASTTGDCDDSRDETYPDAPELCDGRDNDCDSETDEDPVDAQTFFVDADRDSWGGDDTIIACTQPSGAATRDGDCDDGRNNVYPGRTEVCDGVDNNCNGTVDLDTPNLPSWYVDADDDSWGAPGTGIPACSTFEGRVSRAQDCDDSNPLVNPDQTEIDGDNLDNDCNGQTDLPTVVPGVVITQDTEWGIPESGECSDGPNDRCDNLFSVDGNILIADGATLTVHPCTQILFAAGRALQVEGTLVARGREDCRIQFTSSSLTPSPGAWGRVIFTSTATGSELDEQGNYVSGSILEYVDVLYAGSLSPGALVVQGSAGPILDDVRVAYSNYAGLSTSSANMPRIVNSVFEENSRGGVNVNNAVVFRGNLVANNSSYGANVRFVNGDTEFVDNTFRSNQGTGVSFRGGNATVATGNWIIGTIGTGAYIEDGALPFEGNVMVGNRQGLFAESYGNTAPVVRNNIIVDNSTSGLGVSFYAYGDGAELVVENNHLLNNGGTSSLGGEGVGILRNNLIQGHTSGQAAIRLSFRAEYLEDLDFSGNAFVGDQVEPWFDVGAASGSPFVDVTNNYWDGRAEPGAAINDFLVDPSRTVAIFDPVLLDAPTESPISYPQDVEVELSGGVYTLVWADNPEADLAGYRVFYGLSDQAYWELRGTGASEGDSGFEVMSTTATVSGLDTSLPWRFSIAAFDSDADGDNDLFEGHESWPSRVAIP